MTLKEAIEELTQYLPTHRWPPYSGLDDAMKLGIEALKVLQHGRLIGQHYDPDLLPGETKD